MLSIQNGAGAPDYCACRYGRSRSAFRGPQVSLDLPYIAMLGGSLTFGMWVHTPFPALVAAATARAVVNLGVHHGGPDVYLSDPEILNIVARADVAVVQITGAETLTNPFYSVHARRNDRFLAATPALQDLFPEVDFTDIHFVRHLLQVLQRVDSRRFAHVVQALKATWVARMQDLLVHLPLRRRLLWVAEQAPPDRADTLGAGGPLFVDGPMLERLRALAGDVIVAVPGMEARLKDAAAAGHAWDGVSRPDGLPGPETHRLVAALVLPAIAAQPRPGRRPPLLLRKADAIPQTADQAE